MEAKLYEMLGRKQAEIEQLRSDYRLLLDWFGKVASGEVSGDRVRINHDTQSWSVAPLPVPPAEMKKENE